MNSTALLEHLIGFPTVSRDGNLDLIGWVSDYLAARGWMLHCIPSPDGSKAGLHARLGPEAPGGVVLSAHSDVVPAAGQPWSRDPFRLSHDKGRLYGRGTADMKGFLAAMLRIADRAAIAGPLMQPLHLVISYDEEVGCRGIAEMLPELLPRLGRPELVIVGEPTSMQIATGHKGKAAYRVTCTGEAGHSASAPQFRNALHDGADMLAELRRMQSELAAGGARDPAYEIPYSTVHAGKMSGGTALNIVPDRCTLDFEIRHLEGDDLTALEARLHEAARRIGPVTVERINSYPGLDVADDAPQLGKLAALGAAPGRVRLGFGTEAGYFHAAGLPTLVCGPGNMAQGHRPDEFIEADQLAACDRLLDRLLQGLVG